MNASWRNEAGSRLVIPAAVLLATGCLWLSGSAAAMAAAIYKINNTDNLNLTTSWSTTSGSQTPNPASIGSTDAAYFNEETMQGSKTVSLGGDLALGGLALDYVTTNGANNLTINDGNTLTLNGTTLYGSGKDGAGGLYTAAGILLNRGSGGTMTVNCDVVVGANQTWTTSRNLTVGGGVNVGSRTLSFNVAGGTTLLSGPLSGSGVITKTGGSNFNLLGDGTTFTGEIRNTSTQALALGSTTAKNASSVSSTGGGYLAIFNAGTTYVRNLNVSSTLGFRADYGAAGTKTVEIEQTVDGGISSQIVQGTRVIEITKTGNATLTISAASNTMSGAINVNAGTLKLGSAVALGTTAGGTTVGSGGVLDLNGQAIGAEALTLNGTGSGSAGGLVNTSNTAASLAGVVTLGSNSSIGGDGNITLSGGVGGGSVDLTKVGGNTLSLTGANTYSGATTVTAGTLALGSAGSLASSTITVSSGATFDISAISGGFSLGSGQQLAGAGTILGDLVFGSDSKLALSSSLTVNSGNVSFSGFGVDDIVGLDGSVVSDGTYTLLGGGATFDLSGASNVGFGQRADIGGGKQAYFQQGSFQVVVVPEPATIAMLCAAGCGLAGWGRTRRRRVRPGRTGGAGSPTRSRWTAACLAGIAFAGSLAPPRVIAADVVKADNLTTLTTTTSWVGGSVPGATDVGVFDSTYAQSGGLNTGGLLTVGGLRVTTPTNAVIINNSTAGQEVAVGSSGIDLSTATQNLSVQRLRVDATQTWDVAAGRQFVIGSSSAARAGQLSVGSGGPSTIQKTGAGTVQLDTGNNNIGNVNWDIQAGLVRAIWNTSSAWGTGTITLGGGGIATGTNFTGSIGNWTWNNAIALTSSTSSFIDNQNIAGNNRWLKLEGVISGAGNLQFRDTGIGFDNLDAGFILSGINTNTGTVTIASAAEVRVGGANPGTQDDIAGNNGKLAADAASVVNNGSLTFSRLDAHTVANGISGSGNLRVGMVNNLGGPSTSTQNVTLSNANTYTGSTTVNNGTLTVSGSINSGSGAVTVGSGSAASLSVSNGGSITTSGSLTLGAGATGNQLQISSGGSVSVGSINNPWATTYTIDGSLAVDGAWSLTPNATGTIGGAASGVMSAASMTTANAVTTINYTAAGSLTVAGLLTLAPLSSGTFAQSNGVINVGGIAWGGGSQTLTLTGGRLNVGSSGIASSGGSSRTINLGAGTLGVRAADWSSEANMALTNVATGTVVNTLDAADGTTPRAIALSGVLSGAGSLTKEGAGTLTLGGANTYAGDTTVNGGTLLVNGSLANTSGVSIAAGATLGGSGTINAILAGAGLVSPGNSPGITTATAVDPSGGMSYAFEFTATGSPTYGDASASVNDVLRLTDGTTPFLASLSGGNVVDVYLDVASLSNGDTFKGGFYTDRQSDFLSSVENGTYSYWVKGNGTGTDRTFNGQGYFSLSNFDSGLSVTLATVAETANFAGGSVSGQVMEFAVVPEPSTLLLAVAGLGLAGWQIARRRRDQ